MRFMRCLRILLLTTICPILRYYIGDAGGSEVGGKVAEINITLGVRRDAGRRAPGETQAAGRKALRMSRDARHGRVTVRFTGRGTGREGSRIPRRMSRPPSVSRGETRRRGERE
jgi:hypothetical protein